MFDDPASVPGPRRDPELNSPEVRRAVLERMGVQFVVTDRELPDRERAGLEVAASQGTFTLFRVVDAAPRAYVVPRAIRGPDDRSLAARFPGSPLRYGVFLEDADPLPAGSERQKFTPARYESQGPDRLIVRVRTQHPGLLVVADTWMPGWRATVDGKPVTVLRGNRCQRVVPLPAAGEHVVTMWYVAPGLAQAGGLALAGGLTWAMLLAAALVMHSGRRTSAGRGMHRRLEVDRLAAPSSPGV
jgi:hypothetical protein